MSDPSSILVLGATGFLGSHVRSLLESDPTFGAGVYLARTVPADPGGGSPRWIECDLAATGVEELTALVERVRPRAIINCAGAIAGTPSELWELNVRLLDKLLRAVEHVGGIELVQLGSAAEYGRQEPGIAIRESAHCRPVSGYGTSKLAATELLRSAVRERRVSGTVLRVFNPVGSGASRNTLVGRAAAIFSEARRSGAASVEFAPLGAYRDFVDARDVARAALLAATRPPSISVLNVGSGEAVITRSLVLLLASISGFAGEVRESLAGSDRSAGVGWQAADISLSASTLGWAPQYRLDESLGSYWAAYEAAELGAGVEVV